MQRQSFLRAVMAVILAPLLSTLGVAPSSAGTSCACLTYTVQSSTSTQCCVNLVLVCTDGSRYPINGGANICPGNSFTFDCPCKAGFDIQGVIVRGPNVPVNVGQHRDIQISSGCCVSVAVTTNASGCVAIQITPGSCP